MEGTATSATWILAPAQLPTAWLPLAVIYMNEYPLDTRVKGGGAGTISHVRSLAGLEVRQRCEDDLELWSRLFMSVLALHITIRLRSSTKLGTPMLERWTVRGEGHPRTPTLRACQPEADRGTVPATR